MFGNSQYKGVGSNFKLSIYMIHNYDVSAQIIQITKIVSLRERNF